MSYAISIIVPIYKVEKWLHRCLDSILNQPFSEFELILVNDGSPDSCGQICDEYALKDKRIKVIHKANSGTSSARNAGIEAASGQYISFVDPDDTIKTTFFTTLYHTAANNNCDVIISGFNKSPSQEEVSPRYKLHTVMNGKELILSSPKVNTKLDLCFVWRNLFRLSFIKEHVISFNEDIHFGEDTLFNLDAILASERVYAISDPLYNYTINNPNSAMNTLHKPKLEQSLSMQYELRKRTSEKFDLLENKRYRQDLAYYYLKSILSLFLKNLHNSPIPIQKSALANLLKEAMFTDSIREIGWLYQCDTVKEYLYYLALKFQWTSLLFQREFGRPSFVEQLLTNGYKRMDKDKKLDH